MDSGILSQSELEALLGDAPSTGGTPAAVAGPGPKVRAYDFRRPDKLARDQVRSLQIRHETLARSLSSSLSSRFRAVVQVSLRAIDQCTYADFYRRVGDSTVLCLVSMEPLPGQVMIELGAPTAMVFVDRLLGGEGKPTTCQRPPTDIEMVLLRGLMESLLPDLQEVWQGLAEVRARLLDTVLAANILHTTFGADPVALVTLNIQMGQAPGSLTFCLPWLMLEPVAPKLSARANSEQPSEPRSEPSPAVSHTLRSVEVTATAALGTAALPIRELLSLRVGDVVRLDQPFGQPVKVSIGGRPRFKARPGLRGSRVALQVTEVLSTEPNVQ